MISLQNVSKFFGSTRALNNVSFTIGKNEIVGFLGPNGAGKTTTMRLITGVLLPTKGQVLVAGVDVTKEPLITRRKIGYLPEANPLYADMAVVDFLLFMGRLRGLCPKTLQTRLSIVSTQCGLEAVLGRKIAALSKGFKQRVGLAQALLADPEILILDEPTMGLDPNQIGEIRELIKAIGQTKTILLSSHILPEIENTCQKIIVIHQGQIVAQGPAASLAGPIDTQTCRITLKGPLTAIKQKLEQIPGFKGLVVVESRDDKHTLLLTSAKEQNLGEVLFQLAVAQGWALTELVEEQASLETVFRGLTQ